MSSKKVLVIAYYFPPMGLSGVQRTLKFVKYLPEFGWEPIVLTTNSGSYYAYDESLMEEIEGVNVFRTNDKSKRQSKYPSTLKQKLGRFVNGIFLQPDSKIRWKKIALDTAASIMKEYEPDVIYSTAPPFTSHLLATELADKYGIPLVLDYRDQWYGNPFNSMPTMFHKNYNRKLEEKTLYASNKIIVITREQKEKLLKNYKLLKHNDINIVPHGYDSSDFKDIVHSQNKNTFVITHSGMFQDNRNPKPFFVAFKQFVEFAKKDNFDVQLKLIGLMRKNHLKIIKKLNLSNNVILTGNISHSESIIHLVNSNILWILQNDSVRTPGKLYEYFGSGKPIIATMPKGYMRELALSSGVVITAEPEDSADILKAIKVYYELWKQNSLPKPNKEFLEGFDRKKLTEQLSQILSSSSIIQ